MEVTKFKLWDNKKAIFLLLTIFLVATLSCVNAIEENDTQTTDTLLNTPTQQTSPTATEQSEDITTYQTSEDDYDADAIYLTKENYEEYNGLDLDDNTILILNESLENIELYLYNNNKIFGRNNATLYNSYIELDGNENILANISFNNSAIGVYGDNNVLTNLTFNSDDESIDKITIVLDGQNNTVDHVNFTDYRNTIIDEENYRAIDSYGDYNTITDCAFDITYPPLDINWETGGYEVECESTVMVIHGNHNTVKNNNILVNESENKEYPYGTIYTMSIYGQENLVDLNNIVMTGTIYLYGIHVYNDRNNITNNFILVDSIRYANGIAIESYANYNLLRNNTIIINTKTDKIDNEKLVDAAYGIMITEYDYRGGSYRKTSSGSSHNVIDGNTITGYSTNMYAIETFGGTSTTISNNNIDVSGSSTIGIASVGGQSQITNNNIRVTGDTNATQLSSPDYLKPQTSGIYLYQGNGNTVSGNTITSDHGAAIKLENEDSATISSNTLNVLNNAVGINVVNSIGTTTINDNSIVGKMITQVINILGKGDGIITQNNYDPTQPQTPESDNTTQQNETTQPSENSTNTTTPETNQTDTNQTDTPEPEPQPNQTDTPEPEPQPNQTDTPEPEPQPNQTDTPEPEPQPNQTEIPETNQTNTTTPTIIVENQTVTTENQTQDSNQTIVPEKVEELNKTPSVINNTKTETNQTATAGEKPDVDNGDEPEQSDDPTPAEPEQPEEPEQQQEQEQQEDTQDTQTQTTTQEETKASQTNSESSPAVVSNKKIYEITKKLPEAMVQPDILIQILILLILGLALTYGFTKKT